MQAGDHKAAFKHYQIAATHESGSAEGQYFLRLCFLKGLGTERDLELGVAHLTSAMNAGFKSAAFDLGINYLNGDDGFPKNFRRAQEYFKKYSDKDPKFKYHYAVALYYDVGVTYYDTDVNPEVLKTALAIFSELAKEGHENSQKALEIISKI